MPSRPLNSSMRLPPCKVRQFLLDISFDRVVGLHLTISATVAAAAQGWSPIQIAAPIISGGCVAIVAFVIFLFYRRRLLRNIYGSSRPLWQEAHLHGKRRCCGLLPGRKKVKKATVDTLWQIDQPGNPMDVPPQQPRSSSRNGDIELFSHSRETSASSLLPDTYSTHSSKRSFHSTSQAGSQSGNGHSSLFHSIMAKISGNSLNRTWYTSGVDKGPEYKKVTVMQEPPPPGFKIDGTGSTPSRANTFVSRVENSDEDQQSHHSLPSVINIGPPSRSNSLSTGSHTGSSSGHSAPSRKFAGGGTQMQSIEEEDERATEYSAFRPTRSDFTLTTSDLRTPITNSSYRMGPPSSQAHSSVSIITFSYLNLFLTDVRLLHYSPLYGWLFHDRPTLNPMCCLCHHPPRPAHERTRIHPNVWYFAYVSSFRFCTDKYFRFIVAGFLGHFLLYYDV